MDNRYATINVDTADFMFFIHGVATATGGLMSSAFSYNSSAYLDDPHEAKEWFIEHYDTVAGINTLLHSTASIMSNAITNGEIEITAATGAEKKKD